MSLQTLRASTCGLSASMLPSTILDVIDHLSKAGFDAYIVGGGVRDLMLGEQPKDFDAVTNATPSQIKQVFGRRCRIIGRRFELAHVHCGREIIEVATFRAPPKKTITNASGMILRDNHWGTIQQDFARRDFSINSLYYQPRQGIVLDFCNAYSDIQHKKLRLLGNAAQRFEEDPVRLLRALRFAAKLDFNFDDAILAAFDQAHIQQLSEVSPHRLYDETQKMFTAGKLKQLLSLLIKFDVWSQLLPDVPAVVTALIERAAQSTDQRLAEGKTVNVAFFYAILLWHPYLERIAYYQKRGVIEPEARIQAGLDVLKRQSTRTIMPRFAEMFIREVWELQSRLVVPKPQHIMQLLAHPKFRAGFDFLVLREQSGDNMTQGMGQWWADFQAMTSDQKEANIARYRRTIYAKRVKVKDSSVLAIEDSGDSLPPLVLEREVNSRAARRAKQKVASARAVSTDTQMVSYTSDSLPSIEPDAEQSTVRFNPHQFNESAIALDHPLRKRKRPERDLTQVIFGPTQ